MSDSESTSSILSLPASTYSPTYLDVRYARAIMNKFLGIPLEVVLDILDHAQYWPIYQVQFPQNHRIDADACGHKSSTAIICDTTHVYNDPVCEEMRKAGEVMKIKSVKFDMISHDQGWSSVEIDGAFGGTSWLEASIMRGQGESTPEIDLSGMDNMSSNPEDYHHEISRYGLQLVRRPEQTGRYPQDYDYAWYVQGNRVASDQERYQVTWTEGSYEGNEGAGRGQGFVTELREGDLIVVWARAKWPGWRCTVRDLKITVFYGF